MPVLASGVDLIWVVVVVGSIIAQIIKAKKNAASPPPKNKTRQPGAGGRDFVAPNDELREFLKSIGAPTPPAPQQVRRPAAQNTIPRKTQPVQVRQTTPPPLLPVQARIKHRPSPLETEREQPKTEPLPLPPLPQYQPQESQETTTLEIAQEKHSVLTRMIRKELQDLDSTRKSMVLREILGPPIALRKAQNL